MRFAPALLTCVFLAACGGQPAEAPANEATRVTNDLVRQARQLTSEAENGTAAIERALENESAAIFENRGNLLNESAGNAAGEAKR